MSDRQEAEAEELPWDTVAAVRSSKIRSKIVNALTEGPLCASEIGDQLGYATSTVSKHIHWLKNEDPSLVHCKTPDRPHHRLYALTEEGRQVAVHV